MSKAINLNGKFIIEDTRRPPSGELRENEAITIRYTPSIHHSNGMVWTCSLEDLHDLETTIQTFLEECV